MYYRIRDIALFPLRLVGSAVEILWSAILGFGGFSPGYAPVFLNNDQAILFLKRQHSKYYMMLHELASGDEEIIYASRIPIEQYLLRAKDELVCRSYEKGHNKFAVFELRKNGASLVNHYLLSSYSRHVNVLLPKGLGIIQQRRICSYNECSYQLVRTNYEGEQIIENNVDVIDHRSISISDDETYVAFSSNNGIHIDNLLTWQQLSYPCRSHIFNWDNESNLLTYDIDKKHFLLINPATSGHRVICIPDSLSDRQVGVAAVSPKGTFIAYHLCSDHHRKKGDGTLVLLATRSLDYNLLSPWALVFDIKWSHNENYISVAGVKKRDLLDITYTHKMRNTASHDKEIVDREGVMILRCT